MNRLRELIEELGLSAEEFAKMFGINRSSVYRYTGGNKNEPRDLPMKLAVEISERFNVSLDWLCGNEGAKKYRKDSVDTLLSAYNQLSDVGKKELYNFAMYILDRESRKENSDER